MNNDIDLLHELMNYHRDRVDELISPEDRLERIPFHLDCGCQHRVGDGLTKQARKDDK